MSSFNLICKLLVFIYAITLSINPNDLKSCDFGCVNASGFAINESRELLQGPNPIFSSYLNLFSNLFSQEELKMEIKSSAFNHGKPIPKKHTCEGEDISPMLTFHNVPKGTQSLALIVDDPDAPRGTFDHWIGWNLNPDHLTLSEGESLPVQGKNGFGEIGYRGPCPPPGSPHRYFFKLYALDTKISLPSGSSKRQLEEAIKGHVIEKAELFGTFQR